MSFVNAYFLWILLPLTVYFFRGKKQQSLQQYLRWIALFFLVLAMARPVLVQHKSKETLPAHSIIVALDLSVSMNADDIQPSRAKASRATIKAFLEANLYDQISLIGFTINPLLLSPSTTDHKLIGVALDAMRSEYLLTKGTDLKKLLEKVAAFPDKEKMLLLFSDGGDEPVDEELVEFAKESNIEVLVVAMATQSGSTISDKNGDVLKDKAGHIVVSKFNSSVGALGKVVPFEGVASTVSNIQTWIEEQKSLEDGVTRESRSYFELFFVPAFLALVFLFLSATRFSLKVVALLALLNIPLQAGDLHSAYEHYENEEYNATLEELSDIEPKTLESQLALGNTYYKLKKYKKAKSIFKTLKSTNLKIKQQVLYALGNCEAKMAYYEKAKNYYVKALQLGEDNDTLHNLELVIFFKDRDSSKVGFTNPNSAEASNSATELEETEEEKPSSSKEEKSGSSGGGGSKKSKNSTVKVVKSTEASKSKREMSSKAYDLINEGYIREQKPW